MISMHRSAWRATPAAARLAPGGGTPTLEPVSGSRFDPATYPGMVRAGIPGYEALQRAVVEAAEHVAARRILDLGTGTGETAARILTGRGAVELVGIDESAAMLAAAASRLGPSARLEVRRLEDPLPDGPFDLVVSALAVHHLDGPAKRDLFVRVGAALAPGGRFVLGDLVVPAHPELLETPPNPEVDRPDRAEDQRAWMAAAGLEARISWQRADLAVMVGDRAR
jgi:tRNA (cmo5U34)-methyltransferase